MGSRTYARQVRTPARASCVPLLVLPTLWPAHTRAQIHCALPAGLPGDQRQGRDTAIPVADAPAQQRHKVIPTTQADLETLPGARGFLIALLWFDSLTHSSRHAPPHLLFSLLDSMNGLSSPPQNPLPECPWPLLGVPVLGAIEMNTWSPHAVKQPSCAPSSAPWTALDGSVFVGLLYLEPVPTPSWSSSSQPVIFVKAVWQVLVPWQQG